MFASSSPIPPRDFYWNDDAFIISIEYTSWKDDFKSLSIDKEVGFFEIGFADNFIKMNTRDGLSQTGFSFFFKAIPSYTWSPKCSVLQIFWNRSSLLQIENFSFLRSWVAS